MNYARDANAPIDLTALGHQSHDLCEQVPDGVIVADLDGRVGYANRAACAMLGYQRDELLARTFLDLIPDHDAQRLAEVKQVLLRGDSHVGEWLFKKQDGGWLPVEVSARILPDGRWMAFVRDSSGRKAIEDALRLSEARFSGIVTLSADAIISMDESHRIVLFNDGAEKMFGYARDEVMGRPLDMLIPQRFQAGHHKSVERFAAESTTALRTGRLTRPVMGRRKNGEEFPADNAVSKVTIGGVTIFTATLRDITAERRADAEQRFLSEVGAVLASTLDYEETLSIVASLAVRELTDVCMVDVVDEPDQLRRLKVVSRDPSLDWACQILSTTPLDRRRPHLVSAALESKQAVLIDDLSCESIGRYAQSEEHLRALCALAPTSAIAVPLLVHDQLLGAICFVASASRRHGPDDLQVAEALALRAALAIENARLYRSAQRAINARDEVLGIVAHDLRNPLAAILMQTQLLKNRLDQAEARTVTSVDGIRRAALRMNRMIEDLMDVTRMEAGHLTVDRCGVPSVAMVAEFVETQRPLAAASSVELRADIDHGAPEVWGDRDRLLQVLENLVGNALKFTDAGGAITVGVAARGDEVVFWVADTGSGIAADDLPHVFERFWQAGGQVHRGAGLGLQIVKGLVEAHGGRVWAESAVGMGTRFFFTIPLPPAEAQRIGAAPSSGNRPRASS